MIITPTEQRIYRHFYNQSIFTLEDCLKFLKNNYRAALVATKNLVSKKYILKVKRGIFYVIPFEKTNKWLKDFVPDKFIIASKLVEDSFISHNTALEFYGMTEKDMNNVYLCSKNKIPDVKVKPFTFSTIKTKFYFGFEEKEYKGQVVLVSDKERTILDCLRNVNYISSLEEFIVVLEQWGKIDFEKIYEYLCKIDEVSLYARVGYMMDFMKFKLKTPDWFRSKVMKKLSDRTYYLDISKKGSSRHVKDWKLMVPEAILRIEV